MANGVRSAAMHFGSEALELALHCKGIELPAHEPRSEAKVLGLQYAVSPRGACHMHPNWASTWMMTSPAQSNQVKWKIAETRKAEELLNGEELRERGSTYRSMDIAETDR